MVSKIIHVKQERHAEHQGMLNSAEVEMSGCKPLPGSVRICLFSEKGGGGVWGVWYSWKIQVGVCDMLLEALTKISDFLHPISDLKNIKKLCLLKNIPSSRPWFQRGNKALPDFRPKWSIYLNSDQRRSTTIPFGATHIYITYIRVSPTMEYK